MAMASGTRNLVMLGTAPNEFLVHADDSEEEVRAAMQKMLPGTSFELQPLTPKQTAAMNSRLSASQHALIKSLGRKGNASVKKNASAFRRQLPGDQRMAVSANKNGVIKFDPQIS